MTNASLHTFLFDIIKLLVTISIGVLSLSIAFVDKIKLNLNNRSVNKTLSTLWISLIGTLMMSIVSGFSIFEDIGKAIHNGTSEVNPPTKVLLIITLVTFCFVIFSLVKIGVFVIRQKKLEMADEAHTTDSIQKTDNS